MGTCRSCRMRAAHPFPMVLMLWPCLLVQHARAVLARPYFYLPPSSSPTSPFRSSSPTALCRWLCCWDCPQSLLLLPAGNPRFCNLPPGGASWVLCSSTEKVCDEKFENLNSTACAARPAPPSSSSSSLKPGVIAGIAVGAAVGVALAAAVVAGSVVVWRRRRRRRQTLPPGALPPKPASAGDGYNSLDGNGGLDGFRPPTTASAFHAEVG